MHFQMEPFQNQYAADRYYKARGAANARVEILELSLVAEALRAAEVAAVSRLGVQVRALTQEATRQRWSRAGAMLYLRHRACALSVGQPFGYNYTHVLVLREDNVWLTPRVSLAGVIGQLDEAARAQLNNLSYAHSAARQVRLRLPFWARPLCLLHFSFSTRPTAAQLLPVVLSSMGCRWPWTSTAGTGEGGRTRSTSRPSGPPGRSSGARRASTSSRSTFSPMVLRASSATPRARPSR